MKISIITATLNSGRTVGDTLESVAGQTHDDYEVIVVDGGSKDDTLSVVDGFRPRMGSRLRVISGKDSGLYDAMNKGIAAATGDVIGVLNSDDFYAATDILSAVNDGIADVDAVYGDLDFVDQEDTSRVVRQWKGSQHEPGAFLKGWHPAHPTFYARRECFSRFGDFDITFDVSADFELMLRFIEKNRIRNRYLPLTFVRMRMGGVSTGSLSRIIEGNRNVIRAFRKNGFRVSPILYPLRRLLPKVAEVVRAKLFGARKEKETAE